MIAARGGFARRVLPVLVLLALFLGGNHLQAALAFGKLGNWIGVVANALGLALAGVALTLAPRAC